MINKDVYQQSGGSMQWYDKIPLKEVFYNFVVTTTLPKINNSGEVYKELIKSVLSQQLSVKAAATIYARFINSFPNQKIDPELLLRRTIPELKEVGCSRQKAGYIQNITKFFLDSSLIGDDWSQKKDQEIIDQLTQIKGVGEWTVQMVLIFCLKRPDVFASNDLGIQQAMSDIYDLSKDKKSRIQKMIKISESWRPFNSMVCRYLWSWNDRN